MTQVADASLVIRLLANRAGDELLRRRFLSPRVTHAPHLIDAEVVSAVRGLLLGKKIDHDRAQQMIDRFSSLRIVRHRMTPYLQRVLALRHNLTAYDACYLVLAEALELPLVTADAKFAGATDHDAEIQVYPDL